MRAISRQQVEGMKMQVPVLEAFAALKRRVAHACNAEAEAMGKLSDTSISVYAAERAYKDYLNNWTTAAVERARAQCELMSAEVIQIESQIAVIKAAIAEAENPSPMISTPGQFT